MEFRVPTLTRLLRHPRTKKRKRAYAGCGRFQAALKVWQFDVEEDTLEITDDTIHYTLEVGVVAKKKGSVYILKEFIGGDSDNADKMEPPLESLPDTIVHRELYQLLLACLILKKQYDCDLFSQAYLIQVHKKGVTKHPLPTLMIQHADAIYAKERDKHT